VGRIASETAVTTSPSGTWTIVAAYSIHDIDDWLMCEARL
jgi:hypothetical protein